MGDCQIGNYTAGVSLVEGEERDYPRQAYLVETDTVTEPFKDPIETETPESPHIVASPTSLPDSKPPACHAEELEDSDTSGARSTSSDSTAPLSPDHPLTRTLPTHTPTRSSFHRKTARMIVRTPPVMSPGHSARVTKAMALSDLAFRKRIGLLVTLFILYSLRTFSTEKGLGLDDEGHGLDDEGHGLDDEGRSVESYGLGLEEEEEAVPKGHRRAILVVEAATSEPLGLWYGALRHRELAAVEDQIDLEDGRTYIDVPAYLPSAPPIETPPSPEWSSGSLHVSPTPSTVPSPISSPMISLTIPSPIALPVATLRGHAVTFGALWRLMLALEAWQAAMQCELQEIRGHVTALEQERDRKE
ncbi:hypothetical protein Tco_0411754 [Tanacetum coccineum]